MIILLMLRQSGDQGGLSVAIGIRPLAHERLVWRAYAAASGLFPSPASWLRPAVQYSGHAPRILPNIPLGQVFLFRTNPTTRYGDAVMRWINTALSIVGLYALYHWLRPNAQKAPAAFAPGEEAPENFVQVRNAGPDAMRSPHDDWDKVDQASDESFPASDASAKY